MLNNRKMMANMGVVIGNEAAVREQENIRQDA
jgi:hypothetical protein